MSHNVRQTHPHPASPYRAPWVPVLAENRQLQTELSKGQEDEIQQTLRGPGISVSSAPAASDEPGIGPSRRLSAELVTRCPLALMPTVKALRGTATVSRSERT
jgi:hypothetical protein